MKGFGHDFALSASAVRPNETFKAAFLLTPTDDAKLEVGKEVWPTFTPIAGLDWMVNDIAVKTVDGGRVLVVIEGETFEPEPLPTNARIGGLFQVKVNGEWVRTEIEASLPWAATGTEVTPSHNPIWKMGGGDGADDETSGTG